MKSHELKHELNLVCRKCGEPMTVPQRTLNNFLKSVKSDLETAVNEKEKEVIRLTNQFQKMKETLHLQETDIDRLVESQLQTELKKRESEMNTRLSEATKDIQAKYNEQAILKISEKEKIISNLTTQLSTMKDKLESSNVKIIGSVVEENLLSELSQYFDKDEYIAYKNGQPGADLLMVIKSDQEIPIGPKILIESKHTKVFASDWVRKIKDDLIQSSADVGVIVTSVFPKKYENEKFYIDQGIFITKRPYARFVISLLRYSCLKIALITHQSKGKNDKKEALYSYITSNTYRNLIESTLNSYELLRKSYELEQHKVMSMWRDRKKILDSATENLLTFVSTIDSYSLSNENSAEYRQAG